MLTKGDFHIHSTASDGDLSPEEIVVFSKVRGIDVIALADHNTTDGIDEAAEAGKKYGVSVIPAVELSTRYNHENIHILGYFKDFKYKESIFQEALKLIKTHQTNKVRKMLSNLMITETRTGKLSVLEGINFLKTFGAAVVLAHPVRVSEKNIAEIIKLPFDGIESRYCLNNSDSVCTFVHKEIARFSFYTAGSDFHTRKADNTMHSIIGNPYLNSEEIKIFLEKSGALVLS